MFSFLTKFFQRTTTQEHVRMSLEQALSDNTAAVKALTEAMNLGKPALTAAAPPAAAKANSKAPPPAGVIDYASVVNPKVLEAVRKAGREATVAILASFSGATGKPAANGKEVQSADYPALVAKLQAAIDAAGTGSLV